MRRAWYPCLGRKKNNKGSSIVTVIVVMALVLILVMSVMSLALVNFRMKHTSLLAQQNFYDAETALEEIRLGLAEDMSYAAADAYVDTVTQYGTLDGDQRRAHFCTVFVDQLKAAIGYLPDGAGGTWPVSYLEGKLKETAYDVSFDVGAKVSSGAGGNRVNITADGITLKNVLVTYRDQEGYESRIQTDLVLEVPEIYFSTGSEMPDLTSYALVAEKKLDIAQGFRCEITGNAYLGGEATTVDQAKLVIKPSAGRTDRGLVIAGDMLKGCNNASLDISGMEVWAEDLVVDSSVLAATDSAIYLRDDLVLANSLLTSTQAEISGEYYGYGSVDSAALAESVQTDAAELALIAKNPADYSSSVILNGIWSSLDMKGLSALKISGNSYINGTQYRDDYAAYGNLNTEDVKMGESLSIRSDQIAYLVPAECIAPDTAAGGSNPMPISQYQTLLAELQERYGETAGEHLVDLGVQTKKYGQTLTELGVSGWQIEAQQVNGIGSMVYVFLKFDSAQSINAFFRKYYDVTGTAKLGELLDLYAKEGIHLPREVLNQTADDRFYFNGNVLASDSASLYVPDRLDSVMGSADKMAALREEEAGCQDSFFALNHKLTKDYKGLTEEEKGKNVYENLVKSMVSGENTDYTISEGSRIFVKSTGEAAVVANGDYTLDAASVALMQETPDMEGNKHSDAKPAVIIASGDITVTRDFSGLLLAGGQIHVDGNPEKSIKITADRDAVSAAFMAGNEAGVRVWHYLVSGESYCIAGDTEGMTEDAYSKASLDMLSYITYANWSKR